MIKIIKKKINMSDELKTKIDWSCKFSKQKYKILSKINDIQPKIKELRKYDKYCKSIKERAKSIQTSLNNFDENIQKEKDNSRSL